MIDKVTVSRFRYEMLIEIETKYNQLFEWQHEHGNDEILKVIDNEKLEDLTREKIDDFKPMINEILDSIIDGNKETSTTKEQEETRIDKYYDVELLEDYDCIPKGAKGKLLELDSTFPYIDWDDHYGDAVLSCYNIKRGDRTYQNVYCVPLGLLKKINESEEN